MQTRLTQFLAAISLLLLAGAAFAQSTAELQERLDVIKSQIRDVQTELPKREVDIESAEREIEGLEAEVAVLKNLKETASSVEVERDLSSKNVKLRMANFQLKIKRKNFESSKTQLTDLQNEAKSLQSKINQNLADEEATRVAEEKRKEEEAARLAEEKRKAEEAARLAEEKRKAEEAARLAEEKRKAEEAARLAEEKRKAEEAAAASAGGVEAAGASINTESAAEVESGNESPAQAAPETVEDNAQEQAGSMPMPEPLPIVEEQLLGDDANIKKFEVVANRAGLNANTHQAVMNFLDGLNKLTHSASPTVKELAEAPMLTGIKIYKKEGLPFIYIGNGQYYLITNLAEGRSTYNVLGKSWKLGVKKRDHKKAHAFFLDARDIDSPKLVLIPKKYIK